MIKAGIRAILFIFIFALFLSSCSSISKIEVMVGAKNLDFEYMNDVDSIDKIIAQNARDDKFKFIIIDKNAISDIYDMLSRGKVVGEKSDLQPDYTFTVYTTDGSIFKYDYVVGDFTSSLGNFYDDKGKIYYISDSLDRNIINNFLIFRKPPIDFNEIYYNCIIDVMNQYYRSNNSLLMNSLAIDLNNDLEYRRFIFSYDVNNFIDNLKKSNYTCKVYDTEGAEASDITLSIKTIGFDEDTYESKYVFTNNITGYKESYSLKASYKNERWSIDISKDEKEE